MVSFITVQFLAEFDAKALDVGLCVRHATQPYFNSQRVSTTCTVSGPPGLVVCVERDGAK